MKFDDKIDIIMSVYNAEKTLSQAIDSILGQTYKNIRLIICNDCSTDESQKILDNYSIRYPEKFLIIKNEKNMRLAYSLNKCLEYVNTEFVARMDADDISTPQRIEKQLEFLKLHKQFMVVGTGMGIFYDDPCNYTIRHPVIKPNRYTLRKTVPFAHATILARTEMYHKLDGYTVAERTITGQDYDMWFRFYQAGMEGANIDEPLYLCREDINTYKRRLFRYRWNEFKTAIIGYHNLDYPLYWYWEPTIQLLKGLIPARLVYIINKNKHG